MDAKIVCSAHLNSSVASYDGKKKKKHADMLYDIIIYYSIILYNMRFGLGKLER